MQGARFFSRLEESSRKNGSLLCVGLDPSLHIAAEDLLPVNRKIIDQTCAAVCAFKPNIAFYEARGAQGWEALKKTIDHAHSKGLPVILDAKRGDISSTAGAYAVACFDMLEADAVTINPLMGGDSVESFSQREDKGLFLLCHTSNPGAGDLQDLAVEGAPLFERIAGLAQQWNARENIGLVVGATYPEMLARVRGIARGMWILLPGIGTQGGDLEASLAAGLDGEQGRILVNVSRAVCGAPDPGAAARKYRDRINAIRGAPSERLPGRRPAPEPAPQTATLLDQVAIGLYELGAVRFGEFTLKSGQKSPLYLDLRLLVSDPRLMALVARAIAGLMKDLRYDRIAAIPYGGLPIGQAAALATGRPLIYPRREAKDYGTKKLIEGKHAAGETVVVLDDLVTTGASKLEAMAPLSDAGLKVRDVVVLVDREQGAREELAKHGLALHAALSVSQLLDSLVRHGKISDTVRSDVRSALGIH